VGGVPEAVKNNHTGILVTPNAIDELAGAMARLAADECLRKRLGHNAREYVKAEYGATQVLTKLERLYGAPGGEMGFSRPITHVQ
jgi:glycosyltransferase involved in cell wall biosynthesis